MNIFSKIFLFSLMTSIAFGQQIEATKVLGDVSRIGLSSRAWLSSRANEIYLYPIDQTGIGALKVQIKAVYDTKHIAFLLQWEKSDTNSSLLIENLDLQFALDSEDLSKLPFIYRGDTNRGVRVYSQSLLEYMSVDDTNNSQKNIQLFDRLSLEAHGADNLVPLKDPSNTAIDIDHLGSKYRASFTKQLEPLDLERGFIPLSIAISSTKSRSDLVTSPWFLITKENFDAKQAKMLDQKVAGDAARGERLAYENCAACHRYFDQNIAPANMAPSLDNIGGYSTSEYLYESLVDPNAIINKNYDENGSAGFEWYTRDTYGKEVSLMPTFAWMDAQSLDDLVAFLKTLKAQLR